MDFKAIEEMIQSMDNSSLGYLEVDWNGISIIMKKKGESGVIRSSSKSDSQEDIVQNKTLNEVDAYSKENKKEQTIDIEETKKEDKDEIKEDKNIKEVASPIVGTFYSKSAPDKPDFVKVGDIIKKGDTLCIIEAMKIMNEIQSEVEGEVVEILPKNEDMVEYGQCLFKVRVNE